MTKSQVQHFSSPFALKYFTCLYILVFFYKELDVFFVHMTTTLTLIVYDMFCILHLKFGPLLPNAFFFCEPVKVL